MKTTTLERIEQRIRPELRALSAYAVNDASGMVKLDAMENPYVWPEEMRAEWLESLASEHVNRYPDPSAAALKARIRESFGISDGRQITLGNGSDELIQILAAVFSGSAGGAMSVTPSFVMYARSSIAAGLPFEEVSLEADGFALDREAMLEAIQRFRPAVVFLAYPNNPTGNLFDDADMEAVIRAVDGVVVVDEAYEPFAGASWLIRAEAFDNVVVMRTLSKLGLAGLRLGFLVGAPALLNELEKLRLPYNVNVLTQVTAEFALARYGILRDQTARICRDRESLFQSLAGMEEIHVWPSRANFLLFQPSVAGADAVFDGLRRRKVLIKNLHGSAPLLENCLRVTVGAPEENARFLTALEDTLKSARRGARQAP
jgi:histidinol-phosphate aminotransferase